MVRSRISKHWHNTDLYWCNSSKEFLVCKLVNLTDSLVISIYWLEKNEIFLLLLMNQSRQPQLLAVQFYFFFGENQAYKIYCSILLRKAGFKESFSSFAPSHFSRSTSAGLSISDTRHFASAWKVWILCSLYHMINMIEQIITSLFTLLFSGHWEVEQKNLHAFANLRF